jgi:hypothetical protein
MDKRIFQQLADLANCFNRIGLKPVICGGLGIYLCFNKYEGEAQELIRVTNDIDLILTKKQVLEQAKCRAIAEIITGELSYIVSMGALKPARDGRFKTSQKFFSFYTNFVS